MKTKYPGVYYIYGKGVNGSERIYYIQYRRRGKLIEEKAGRQFQDDMTPARAAGIRADRIEGEKLSNAGQREAARIAKEQANGKWTIARLWELYEKNAPDRKSKAADKSRYERYLKPAFGPKEPQDIVPLDVDRLKRKDLKDQSPQTTKHVLALLRRIVNFGVRKQVCAGLSFALEMPAVDNMIIENLSSAQLSNLLKVLNDTKEVQASHIMLMALYTGMRKGELLKLKWTDIDFDQGFIYIRQPKGKKSQNIPMNSSARSILEYHPRLSEFVFANRDGRPFKDVRKRINPIRIAAKLPESFRPLHGLRHVYASMLASSGKVDMYTLQKLLTHKSPVMTQRYAHLRDEALRQASDLAADIISAATNDKDESKTADNNGVV
jgi:integrase